MKVVIRVENHQPVSLRPLGDVLDEADALRVGETVVFVGVPMSENNFSEWTAELGWCIYGDETLTSLDDGLMYDIDQFDMDKTLGRLLQPGECLHVTYEN